MQFIKKFFKFSIVGFICFLIDLTFTILLIKIFGFPKTFARFPSWLIAVSSSYLLNKNFTFKSNIQKFKKKGKRIKRFIFYISSQALGGLVNIMVYSISIIYFNFSITISIILGTIFGLFLNFAGAKTILKNNSS